jgi:hypothetical protein
MPLFGRREEDRPAIIYDEIVSLERRNRTTRDTIRRAVLSKIDPLPLLLEEPIATFLDGLLESEAYLSEVGPPPRGASFFALKDWIDVAGNRLGFLRRPDHYAGLLTTCLVTLIDGIANQIAPDDGNSPFSLPLANALPDAKEDMDTIYGTLKKDKYYNEGILRATVVQLYQNICYASGIDPDDDKPRRAYITADATKLPLDEAVATYLNRTPFYELFQTRVPLAFSRQQRFNHMHIVGGAGAGKTTLIENLIVHDLKSDDPPSLVIVDPHSDLVQKLLNSDLGIEDRLIYINPRDINYPPALNVFSLNQDRLGRYDEAMREQVTASVIETFDYLFSGIFSAELTAKQGVFFRYVARLLLTLPETMGRNATILDMLHLMSDAGPYQTAIGALPPIVRSFFEQDFNSRTFAQTKEQIRYRLQAIIESPTLARLFMSTETKVDLFDALNSGAIILVDTAKDFLKGGSSIFGRIIISLVLQAVLERAAIPEGKRKDTFLIVDEAASYFDSNIDDLLTDARKYRCGCVFSHQYLDQATGSLRASLAANTAIKFASGVSAGDARSLATEMRTHPDFILSQPPLHFSTFIRGVTSTAVSVPIRHVKTPRLSQGAVDRLLDRNRERVSLPSQGVAARGGARSSPQVPDEEFSKEW